MPSVFVAALMERQVADHAVLALMEISRAAGERGYTLLGLPYTREDVARNHYTQMFLGMAKSPDDALIMLDCDHDHPGDLVDRLLAHRVDMVGALAFNRGAPHVPCVFVKDDDGKLVPTAIYPQGLVPCAAVGSGAIAIRRRVFDKIKASGAKYPFWRWEYLDGVEGFPSDDIFFAKLCERAGVQQYVDTELVTPHLALAKIDQKPWDAYVKAHADKFDLVVA